MSYYDTYYHGKDGAVVVNGVSIAIQKWELTETAGDEDVTATTDGGFFVPQGGVKKVTGTFEAKWNATQTPQSQGWKPGNKVSTTVSLYVNDALSGGSQTGWTFPIFYIADIKPTLVVNGVVTYTVSFTNVGTYTAPT